MSVRGEGIISKEVEVALPMPDLMAEYHDVQITVFGLTGTPEELLKPCPVPHEKMTLEAKNMFLVMAMNTSGAEIKADHLDYFQQIVEARGEELRVTVADEATEVQFFSQSTDQVDKQANPNKRKKAYEETRSTVATATASTESRDESTEQMDAWLTQIQAEYEKRQRIYQELGGSVVEGSSSKDKDLGVDTKKQSKKSKVVDIITEPTEAPMSMSSEEVIAVRVHEGALKSARSQNTKTKKVVNETTANSTSAEAVVQNEHIIVTSPVPEKSVPDDGQPTEPAPFSIKEVIPAPTSVTEINYTEPLESSTQAEPEALPLVLADLLPSVGDYKVLTGPEQSKPVPLIEQINDYIEKADESTQTEAAPLVQQVEDLSVQIIDLSIQTVNDIPEEIVDLVQDFEEVCENLLTVLGVEYDEDMLKRFILQVVQEKAAAQGVQLPEWLPNLLKEGTHERKTFSLRALISDFQVKLPSFHLLGRYTLAVARQTVSP